MADFSSTFSRSSSKEALFLPAPHFSFQRRNIADNPGDQTPEICSSRQQAAVGKALTPWSDKRRGQGLAGATSLANTRTFCRAAPQRWLPSLDFAQLTGTHPWESR
jgi:hypothetical protein